MNNIAGMDVHVQRRQPQGTGLALAAQPLMPAQPPRLAPRRIAPLPVLGQQWCEANPPAKPRLLMQSYNKPDSCGEAGNSLFTSPVQYSTTIQQGE